MTCYCGDNSLRHRIERKIGFNSHSVCMSRVGRAMTDGFIGGLNSKGSDNMTKKIHVIADESLGGIKREYIRNVIPPKFTEHTASSAGVYFEPTDIVHIDGTRHKLVDRKADVGERVVITEAVESLVYSEVGEVVKILDTDGDTCGGMLKKHDLGHRGAVYRHQYRVLEPVEASPQSNDDIIANLVRRVAELERRDVEHREFIESLDVELSDVWQEYGELFESITGIKRDVESWAQEVEALKHVSAEAAKPQQITIDADVFARLLGGVARD